MSSGYELANCSKRCFPDTLRTFGLTQDYVKVLSYSDYLESNSVAYVRLERTFLVCKTKEFLVFIVKFLYFNIFSIESKRRGVGSNYVLRHVNLSDN